ncbi:MAG: aldo/keto reductase [Chloroflexota bacterium]
MLPKEPFGKTGHKSTRAIFGAAALGNVSQKIANRTLEVLLQYGVNHIDTAASYGNAEKRIGPWMKKHRNKFFLATKTEKRTSEEAWAELNRSFEFMRVSQIDLWQMHLLVAPDEWETAMAKDGALEAFLRARDEGMVRFLGVTGHGITAPSMHLKSLERFPFDSVLFPLNYPLMKNPIYARDVEMLLSVCHDRTIAIQAIKSITRRPWLDDSRRTCNTWYEPLENPKDIDKAVHWVLGHPSVFVNTAADVGLLPKVLDSVSRFNTQTADHEMEDLHQRLQMSPLFE